MMTNEDFKYLAANLRRYAWTHRQGHMSVGENEADVERQAAEAIEELIEKTEELANVVRVETPLGTLIARSSHGEPDYPGIHIYILRPDTNQDLLLSLVEFTADEGDLPETGHIISRVYGDALADEYTGRLVHERIEDYFKNDKETVKYDCGKD